MNSGCTFGTWHPLAAEKLMAYDMNIANDFSTFQNGVIRIRKPMNNGCNLWMYWKQYNLNIKLTRKEEMCQYLIHIPNKIKRNKNEITANLLLVSFNL